MATRLRSDISVLDLFAGVGGLSLGFELAGAVAAAAIEIDERHAIDYARNHPDVPVYRSIRHVEPKTLAAEIGYPQGTLDFLIGGPPCQPFSMAGKRNGTADTRGTLVSDFVRFVRELQPRVFVMENVVGLQSIHDGRYLNTTIVALRRAGYRCEKFILDAADYGVPQHRRRLFVVGSRLDWVDLTRPAPTHASFPGSLFVQPYVTVRDAISDLPKARIYASLEDDDDLIRLPYAASPNAYQRLLRGRGTTVARNGVTRHMPHIVAAISREALPEGAVHESTRYRRLHWDQPSVTLRAGSGSFTALRPIHPDEPRVITVREAARLQSFPDRYLFAPQKKFAHQQIGNSVPPLLAKAIATKLIASLLNVRTGA